MSVKRLRPGDTIRVGEHLGVISEAKVTVDGARLNWDQYHKPKRWESPPEYAVQFKSGSGLFEAWWSIEDFDEIVSLGVFHDV